VTYDKAIDLLAAAGDELAQIRRGKEYSLWRDSTVRSLDDGLAKTDPFRPYANAWLFTGDGGGEVMAGRFGNWAIDRLVAKVPAPEIIAELKAESNRNTAVYEEVSPVLGVKIDREYLLSEGVSLLPGEAMLDGLNRFYISSQRQLTSFAPRDSCVLYQTLSVQPAFEIRESTTEPARGASVTTPSSEARDGVRRSVRYACLLAGTGAVEIPVATTIANENLLFAKGRVQSHNLFSAYPLVSFPVDGAVVKRYFDALAAFNEKDSLHRAIDRLGRARLARSPVDQALELGIAAEIALMHAETSGNTEITYKIGSRAAWLLGETATERTEIFGDIKQLYQARSQAVHSGILSAKSKVDLQAGDELVARTLAAILALGRFPEWSSLTMGGDL
jgi:hypothetical protein